MNEHPGILCTINGCGNQADLLDGGTHLPMCYDCCDEINALRVSEPVSVFDALSDGFRLGLLVGGLYSIGNGW